ncbi:MAG: RluA family pseudouridine synthase [Nitrospinales bacterium]
MQFFEFDIDPTCEKKRLDAFITEMNTNLSRSYAQKLIEQEFISVNGTPSKSKYKLKVGDHIEGTIPEPEPLDVLAENIPLKIIYEDDGLVVVDKPAGMVVHPAPGHINGTLVNALLYHCKDLAGIGGVERPGIVHRLDKDTSGIIVVAKTENSLKSIATQFHDRKIRKVYLALVKGVLRQMQGTIDAPIGRHRTQRKKMAIDEEGRESKTRYELIKQYDGFAYIRLHPTTGRTHQIRVHMASIGNPVIGDDLYGGKTIKGPLIQRQALHAHQLELEYPDGQDLILESPLPDDILKCMEDHS